MNRILILFTTLLLYNTVFAQYWTPQTSPTTSNINSAWAVSDQVCWMSGAGNVIIRTTNGGTVWYHAEGNLTAVDAYDIFALDMNRAWIGGGDGLIYRTTNGGVNWSFVVPTPTNPFIDYVYLFDSTLGFALGDCVNSQWRFYITTNGGVSWTLGANTPSGGQTESGFNNGVSVVDTGNIYWTSNADKIYHGGLRGPISSSAEPIGTGIISFLNINTGIITSGTGAYWTTNGGSNWNPSSGITSIAWGLSHGSSKFWLITSDKIYVSTDNGMNFNSQYTLNSAGVCISMFNNQDGWAGASSGHIYRYHEDSGIKKLDNDIPRTFSLSQNYPNPFNPATTIDFSLPRASNIRLKIYDVLGNEVMNVINEFKPAGNYAVNVNCSNLTSGVYFYTLTAGEYKVTKKMLLIK